VGCEVDNSRGVAIFGRDRCEVRYRDANQAHALLFLGRFDEAKAIYLEDKDKPLGVGKTFGDAVKDDFAEFRKNGIDMPEMKEIESLLAS